MPFLCPASPYRNLHILGGGWITPHAGHLEKQGELDIFL